MERILTKQIVLYQSIGKEYEESGLDYYKLTLKDVYRQLLEDALEIYGYDQTKLSIEYTVKQGGTKEWRDADGKELMDKVISYTITAVVRCDAV